MAMTRTRARAIINALERVFTAEIHGHLPFQSKAKIFQELADDGLVEPMQRKFGNDRWAVTVNGWQLTHAGRIMYCSSCDRVLGQTG